MESIFGLPAHVLFVHFPVVMTPLVALASIAVALSAQARARVGYAVAGAAIVVFISILLAMSSGEGFDRLLQESAPIDDHQALAETARIFVLALVVSLIGLVGPRFGSFQLRQGFTQVFAALTIVFALLSTVWVIRTGHEGARVTWDGVVQTES